MDTLWASVGSVLVGAMIPENDNTFDDKNESIFFPRVEMK
jgi:hypothetical protein